MHDNRTEARYSMKQQLEKEVIGTGPDLVLLNGWGMNRAVLRPVAKHLGTRFRVHTLDMPGYGGSPWTADSAAQDWARRVALVAEQLPARAHVVGWSLGGMLAWSLAAYAPAQVCSVVSVCASPRFVAEADWPGTRPGVLESFAAQLQADSRKTIERFLAVQAMGSPQAREEMRTLREQLQQLPAAEPQALSQGLAWLASLDLRPLLARLTVPTLCLFGRLDGLVPQAVSAQPCFARPPVAHHLFPASAHAPFLTEPEAFIDTVASFCLRHG